MKDCIYREAAKDAAWNDIINNVVEEQGMYGYLVNLVDKVFDNIPAADVRPVVYCRECIHWKKSELAICGNYDMVCDYNLGARYCRHADDFCSKGERRADE